MDSPFSTLSKQPWTPSEDQRLLKAVKSLGMDWGAVASVLVERSPQQCHRRCMALKFEGTKRGNWTADEDALILELTTHFGNRWIAIAQYIPGRNENAVKNRFHGTLKGFVQDFDTNRNNQTNSIPPQSQHIAQPQPTTFIPPNPTPHFVQIQNEYGHQIIYQPNYPIQHFPPPYFIAPAPVVLQQNIPQFPIPEQIYPHFYAYQAMASPAGYVPSVPPATFDEGPLPSISHLLSNQFQS
eukprot:c6402_g1_i1.p1 GENE.c6402_g1_i1~~c6402_g1_i1.p1  ORF type:complete len:240 (-),score=40.80 c6402_g1_i1:12-731(-)